MQRVYEIPLPGSAGEPLELHPDLVNHKVDESKNGQVGYFALDEEAARELSLKPRMLMSVEEAQAAGLDEGAYSITAGGYALVDPVYLSQ